MECEADGSGVGVRLRDLHMQPHIPYPCSSSPAAGSWAWEAERCLEPVCTPGGSSWLLPPSAFPVAVTHHCLPSKSTWGNAVSGWSSEGPGGRPGELRLQQPGSEPLSPQTTVLASQCPEAWPYPKAQPQHQIPGKGRASGSSQGWSRQSGAAEHCARSDRLPGEGGHPCGPRDIWPRMRMTQCSPCTAHGHEHFGVLKAEKDGPKVHFFPGPDGACPTRSPAPHALGCLFPTPSVGTAGQGGRAAL